MNKLNYRSIKNDIKNDYYRIYEGKYGVYNLEILNEYDGVIIYLSSLKLNKCGGTMLEKSRLLNMNKPEFINLINQIIYYNVNEDME